MKTINVGVVGVGEMGRRHAENLRRAVPEARLAAVADIDLARARVLAAELGIDSAYSNAAELVSHPGLEAVVIASPPKHHLSAIVAAARAGKHVFCEKPLALCLDEADAALAAVDRAGVILQIGHMRRYDPPYVAARARIEAGEIGEIVVFKSIGRDRETSPAGACQLEANGTLFHDSTAHDFDLARWLTGDEILELHAYGSTVAIPELRRLGAFDAGVIAASFGWTPEHREQAVRRLGACPPHSSWRFSCLACAGGRARKEQFDRDLGHNVGLSPGVKAFASVIWPIFF